jgi:cysteine desulfuration protein SufE
VRAAAPACGARRAECKFPRMSDATALPPSVARVLDRFASLGREEKMQALVSYARKLEPLPPQFEALDRTNFAIPECQTRVDIFPELRDGTLHFYADVNVRQSPTVAAFLAILFQAVNDQPPAVTLALPGDLVPRLMAGIGLHTRETGLNAMLQRLKRHAADAASRLQGEAGGSAA